MNFTEKYEVRQHKHGVGYPALDSFEDEATATDYMRQVAQGSGVWQVVRVMEVTMTSVAKA